jgi:hypothetical protein
MKIIDALVHGKDRCDSTELVYLNQTLENRGITVDIQRIGERTMIALLTEKDGWETVGVAHTLAPEQFSVLIGSLTAVQDAVNKLGTGRFFERLSQCNAMQASPKSDVEKELRRRIS